MLIEFSVTNFRSIQSRQTLSLAKSKLKESKGLDQNTFTPSELPGLGLLRSAAIYGPNAAGKSNLLLALRTMKDIVVESATEWQRGDEVPVSPFRLDPQSAMAPTEFEVIFIAEGVRYQYGFSATRVQIIEEWLIAYPKVRAQHWFARRWNEKKGGYDWDMGSALQGQKQLWEDSTRSNALFLSTAVQLNSQQLQPVYDWFKKTLRTTSIAGWGPGFTASLCGESVNKAKVLAFLRAADIDIQDVLIERKVFDASDLPKGMSDEIKAMIVKKMEGKEVLAELNTVHQDSTGKPIAFDFEEESDGTQKLFSFAGPWLDTLKNGYVLFIDELHDNLHPKLVQFLVELFHSDETNPKNAQLVFTTHETSILNQEVFRRDQVWFCEKSDHRSTTLFPLTDFSPRKGRENLEMTYLAGRYGALPYVRKLKAG
ncbi:MAG: ATP-binding protein [Gammaproteobacteria bacterium]|nr:ATP-binding protein [Gammaproteobacteria bacterium]